MVVPPASQRIYSMKPNDPRDDRFPPDIKEGILKILIANRAARKGHHIVHRTNTGTTNDFNMEVIDDLVLGINHITTQLAHANKSVDERFSKIESQTTAIQKHLDTLTALLNQSGRIRMTSSPPMSGNGGMN